MNIIPCVKINLIFALLLIGNVCFGQNDTSHVKKIKETESYVYLQDSLIKKEIAMFNFKGSSQEGNRYSLIEIPLKDMDHQSICFHKGSTYINVYSSERKVENDQKLITQLDSIFLVIHSHFWVKFPKAAYLDLYNLIPFRIDKEKKQKSYSSTFYKAFQSKDRRRIYIYMIAGLDKERYEVTWVVKDGQYLLRTIDPI